MNCRQGDLAIIVNSDLGHSGKVVTCIKKCPAGFDNYPLEMGVIWEIDKELFSMSSLPDGSEWRMEAPTRYYPDVGLCPLRGDLSTDEIEQSQPLASASIA